jgi:hypothetical protein
MARHVQSKFGGACTKSSCEKGADWKTTVEFWFVAGVVDGGTVLHCSGMVQERGRQ